MEDSELNEELDVQLKISVKATVDETPTRGSTLKHYPGALQWIDFPENERPESPSVEFYKHSRSIPKEHLLYEWAGLNKEWEIEQLYRQPSHVRHRDMVQAMIAAGMNLPDITSPEFLKMVHTVDYLNKREIYEQDNARLYENKSVATKTIVDPITGEIRQVREVREMSPRERLAISQVVKNTREEMQLLTGQATNITATRDLDYNDEKQRVAEQKVRSMREKLKVDMTVATPPQLPEGGETPSLNFQEAEPLLIETQEKN